MHTNWRSGKNINIYFRKFKPTSRSTTPTLSSVAASRPLNFFGLSTSGGEKAWIVIFQIDIWVGKVFQTSPDSLHTYFFTINDRVHRLRDLYSINWSSPKTNKNQRRDKDFQPKLPNWIVLPIFFSYSCGPPQRFLQLTFFLPIFNLGINIGIRNDPNIKIRDQSLYYLLYFCWKYVFNPWLAVKQSKPTERVIETAISPNSIVKLGIPSENKGDKL